MKVLFVCKQNIGRSQMAKAFYNGLTHSDEADSAGTHVKELGQTIAERKAVSDSKNFYLLDVMNEVGYDLSQYIRMPLQKSMCGDYDLIISMVPREDTPSWLLSSPKYVYWEVADPRGQDYDVTAKIRDEIKGRVEELVLKASG